MVAHIAHMSNIVAHIAHMSNIVAHMAHILTHMAVNTARNSIYFHFIAKICKKQRRREGRCPAYFPQIAFSLLIGKGHQ